MLCDLSLLTSALLPDAPTHNIPEIKANGIIKCLYAPVDKERLCLENAYHQCNSTDVTQALIHRQYPYSSHPLFPTSFTTHITRHTDENISPALSLPITLQILAAALLAVHGVL